MFNFLVCLATGLVFGMSWSAAYYGNDMVFQSVRVENAILASLTLMIVCIVLEIRKALNGKAKQTARPY
ncbi:hypothetical protein [Vibrio nigripulchritudo]|uniref:hypothetical protein n=1 Tax=Vibrio nigripulchritudo TaxID=28173 RepID=UPI0003FF8DB2|nr:hypothetical protein [Vibrio nigripulchritudo]